MPKTIKLKHITKIEGHANLEIKIDNGKIKNIKFSVFEGARYFEGILKGRKYDEASHLSTRICGICSCIHNVAAMQAIENALNIKVTKQTGLLRELMLIGERIRSHTTHLYFFALPDYLGFKDAISMASKHKKEVLSAIELTRLGNEIIAAIAGRDMHPIDSVIGGFTHFPSQEQIEHLKQRLKTTIPFAVKTADLFAKLKYPKFQRETQYFCLDNKTNYALMDGEINCVGKKCIPTVTFLSHIQEFFEPYSTAKFALIGEKSYMTGALARINNNQKYLCKQAKANIKKNKIKFPNYNSFLNNYCQAVEIIHHICRAIEILNNLKIKPEEPVKTKIKAGHGISAVEAPRGLLFHEYTIDAHGTITKANIVTPTAQNIKNIEEDLRVLIPILLKYPKQKVILGIEELIRAYDPCISCSTHFLKIKWK